MSPRTSRSRTVKLEGFTELINKLGDKRLAHAPMTQLLEEASRTARRASGYAIDGGTGLAAQSIQRKVWPQRLAARVYTMIHRQRAMCINKGRKPGVWVQIEKMAAWYKGTPYTRKLVFSREDRREIIKIRKKIHEQGTKGKGFIQAARMAVDAVLPRLTKQAMERLKELARR